MDISVLNTEADYDWAVGEIAKCFAELPRLGSEAAGRFDALAYVIETYERRSWPIEPATQP